VSLPGQYDKDDVANLLRWCVEADLFATHDEWLAAGFACRLEYGEDGRELWALTHREDVTESVEASKWESFSSEPDANSVTLASLMKRAHAAGWTGQVRKTSQAMFSGVAQLAAAAGASLAVPTNGGMPMMAGQTAVAELGRPILDRYLDMAGRTAAQAQLQMPSDHPLAESLSCPLVTADAGLSHAPGIRCPITVVPR
jgi:hypothetical protein